MRVKLLTFRYSATLGGFDDTPLVDFIRDKEVIAFRESFYAVNEVPHVTCVLTYQDAIVPRAALEAAREIPPRPAAAPRPASGANPQRRDGAPDPCEGLSEAERALFNHMREWRSHTAHQEGIPPYLILTNRQLVAIVRRLPESPTALGHVEGVGPGKVERYGKAILRRLIGASPSGDEKSARAGAPEAAGEPSCGEGRPPQESTPERAPGSPPEMASPLPPDSTPGSRPDATPDLSPDPTAEATAAVSACVEAALTNEESADAAERTDAAARVEFASCLASVAHAGPSCADAAAPTPDADAEQRP